MKKMLLCAALFLVSSVSLFAQNGIRLDTLQEKIYSKDIQSVRFHILGLDLSYPIIDLEGGASLLLTFDDVSGDSPDYYYTITHCNQDWTKSDLNPMDYIRGFIEDDIEEFEFSYNTLADYTNYRLILPNDDMAFTKSGNYILKVFSDEGEEKPTLTRRFVVVEPQMTIKAQVGRSFDIGERDTHQEVDFSVNYKGMDIANPQIEITASILQNGRWDNALLGIKPLFAKIDQLDFSYQGKITFEALKEFRHLDLRSFRYNTDKVEEISEYDYHFTVRLFPEDSRADRPYLNFYDLNGNYIIETQDEDDYLLESDYAEVFFYYHKKMPFQKGDVYLFGAFTDWQLLPQYKMTYDSRSENYIGKAFLKQGFYNYAYAYVPKGSQNPQFDLTEGSSHQTENNYTVLIYYRPFGARYDRVTAARTINSVRN